MEFVDLVENLQRRPALKRLDEFINELQGQPFEEKLAFARVLLTYLPPGFRGSLHREKIFNHPVRNRLLLPVIAEWRKREPASLDALGWFGCLQVSEELFEAIELGWREKTGLLHAIGKLEAEVGWNLHEWPPYYLGNLSEDLERLVWMRNALCLLDEVEEVAGYSFLAAELRQKLAEVAQSQRYAQR